MNFILFVRNISNMTDKNNIEHFLTEYNSRKTGNKLSYETKRKYKVFLEKVLETEEDLLKTFLDYTKTKNLVETIHKDSKNQQHKDYTCIRAFLLHNDNKDDELQNKYGSNFNILTNQIALEQQPVENNTNFIEQSKTIAEDNIQDIIDKIICYMYIVDTPLRSDPYTLKVRNVNKETDNFIDFDNKKYVYNKMIKNTNGKILDIPEDTFRLIEKSIKLHDNDYLMVFKTGSKIKNYIDAESFKRRIKYTTERQLGRRMGIRELRPMKSSNEIAMAETTGERFVVNNMLATNMNNSVNSQVQVYNREVLPTIGSLNTTINFPEFPDNIQLPIVDVEYEDYRLFSKEKLLAITKRVIESYTKVELINILKHC
jgi:hypothetical protein